MKDKLDSVVNMTPASSSATWWALFLLELGKNADYDLLIHYLTLAQENKCLHQIRLAAEKIVKQQSRPELRKDPFGIPGPKKAVRRRSGTYKAVA